MIMIKNHNLIFIYKYMIVIKPISEKLKSWYHGDKWKASRHERFTPDERAQYVH